MPKTAKKPQEVAEQKLAHARKMVAEKTKAMARTATSLRFWEGKARRYAKLASLTDAEVDADKLKRKQAAEERAALRVRRGMKIGGAA